MADTQVNQSSGGGGGGIAALLAVLVVLVVVAILWFTGVFGGGVDQDRDIEADINIETPDVTPDAGGQGGQGGQGGGDGDGGR